MKTSQNNISARFETKQTDLTLQGQSFSLQLKKNIYGDRLHIEYALTQAESPVARTSVYYSFNDTKEKKSRYKWFGYDEVPESLFELDHVYVEPEYRGIGTPFMNIIMKDILQFDEQEKTKSKILLLRLNTPEAIAFFDKWNARENGEVDSTSQTTKMIIDTPKIVGDIDFENVFNSSALEK